MEFRIFFLIAFSLFSSSQTLPAGKPGGVTSLSSSDPLATKMAAFVAETVARRRSAQPPLILQMGPVDQQVVAGLLVSFRNLTLSMAEPGAVEDCTATVWSQPWTPEKPKLTKLFCETRRKSLQSGPPMGGGLSDISLSEEGAKKALTFAVDALDKRRNSPFVWQLVAVNKAQHQVVSGSMYHFEVEMAPTSCRKSVGVDVRAACYPNEAAHEKCVGVKVWTQSWMPDPIKLVDNELKCAKMGSMRTSTSTEPRTEAECIARYANDVCAIPAWTGNRCVVAHKDCFCRPPLVWKNTPGKCCDCGPAVPLPPKPTQPLEPRSEAECLARYADDPCAHAAWTGPPVNRCMVAMAKCGLCPPGMVYVNTPGKCCDCGPAPPRPVLSTRPTNPTNPLDAKTEADCMALTRMDPCYRPTWMPFPAPGRCAVAMLDCRCQPGFKFVASKEVCCNCVPDFVLGGTQPTTTAMPVPDKCEGAGCICPPGMTGVEPFCMPIQPPVVDKCEGAGCICPPGMTGIEPFCMPLEPTIDAGSWSGSECERIRAESQRGAAIGMTGQMMPTCEADGSYSAMQCHSSIGYCWCALADGKEVEGTRFSVRSAGYTKPDCSIHRRIVIHGAGAGGAGASGSSHNRMTECQERKGEADQKSAVGMLGHFTPSCEADGSFSADQCHGSTGFCWCALPDGTEVVGTRARGKQDCTFLNGLNAGSTCDGFCTMEYRPVCDSHGNTHGNKCAFEIAACKAKNMNMLITMVKEGPCQGAPGEPDSTDICSLPSRVGFESGISCLALIPKFFFNRETGKCEKFFYGGCGDQIANRFDTKEECRETCAQAERTCMDGDTKKQSCNTCVCSGGIWACTLMGCPEDMLPLLPQPSAIPDKCEGESCKCPPGLVGVQPFCRQPEPEPVTDDIDYRKIYELFGGFGWPSTTSMPTTQYGGVLTGATCVNGATKKEDCNDCHCSNGAWVCTMKFCPPILDSKCPPGMVGFLPNCRRAIPAPQILASGICASSPQLPCCKETIKTLDLLNGPHEIADLSFPDCRPDGYYKPKQCNWAFCHCVDANGGAIEGETGEPGDRRSVKCPGEANLGTSTTCIDGDTKIAEDNCNTCHCYNNIWACTKMFCFDKCEGGSCDCPPGMTGVQPFCRPATNTANTNTMNTMNTGTMNVIIPNRADAGSGEACLSACDAAHAPWKSIGESAPGKSAAWNCMDKCGGVNCVRKCQKVYPNRGEELTVANCMTKRCKSNDKRTTPSTRTDKNRYGVKGGLRSFVTKKQNYGIKSK